MVDLIVVAPSQVNWLLLKFVGLSYNYQQRIPIQNKELHFLAEFLHFQPAF